jgi:hypothetical protein
MISYLANAAAESTPEQVFWCVGLFLSHKCSPHWHDIIHATGCQRISVIRRRDTRDW